jgi:hypothetical protein
MQIKQIAVRLETGLSPSEYQMRFSRAAAENAEGELRRSRG